MKTIVFAIFAAVCLVQVMDARVARDTAAADPWENLISLAQSAWNNVTAAVHLPSQDELKAQLQTQASELASKVQEAVEQLKAQAPQLGQNVSEAVRQASHTLEERANALRQQFPDAAQGVDTLKTNWESTLAELRSIQQSLAPHVDSASENVKQASRVLVEQATAIANQVQQEIQRAGAAH